MLGNLKVRSKLVAVLLAPVVALVAVAGLGVVERAAVAGESRRVGDLTQIATRVTAVASELQAERRLSAALLARDASVQRELAEQRQATDRAVAELTTGWKAVESEAGTAFRMALDSAVGQLLGLGTHRSAVDVADISVDGTITFYAEGTDRLLVANSRIASETDDAGLAAQVQRYVTISRAKELASEEHAIMAAALVAGEITAPQAERLRAVVTEQDVQHATFESGASPDQRSQLGAALSSQQSAEAAELRRAVLDARPGEPLASDADRWSELMTAKSASLDAIEESLARELLATSAAQRTAAEKDQWAYALLAGGAVLIALLLAYLVGLSVVRPLRRLTDAAYEVSRQQLPKLVDALRNPTGDELRPALALTPVEVSGTDEVGQLADAFNSIQTVAVDVAVEQSALLRRGIGDMFVNLARRNQSLLDRQIAFLDELEATERDPDALQDLFKLDHLATRMRRNAESLLILAGAEPSRRWGKPVPLGDVVRAAISEVESYARVRVLGLEDVHVVGNAAVDVAHLFSELLDNATSYSAPDTTVDVVGRRNEQSYVVSISDLGIGMSEGQLAAANLLLSRPPIVGLALSRSLGFIVVARLAARHGVTVRLTQTAFGGTTAVVTLPVSMLAEPAEATEVAPPAPAPDEATGWAAPTAPVPAPEAPLPVRLRSRGPVDQEQLTGSPAPAGPVAWPVPTPAPATLAEAVPQGPAFEDGLSYLRTGPTARTDGGITAAGLIRRIPKLHAAPPETDAAEDERVARASQRSPEEIRGMLSRYRSGLSRGRSASPGPDGTDEEIR